MSFKKYSSIENTYRQKHILKYIKIFPELQNDEYISTEKIDGANIQFLFKPDEKYKVGKRTSYIDEGDSFFDIWNTIDRYKKEIQTIQDLVNETGDEIRMFGELFGPGINGRVDYGKEKQILFFDAQFNDFWLCPKQFIDLMDYIDLSHMTVPVVGKYKNLSEALSASENFNTKIISKENNPAEGIVIQPLNNVYINQESRFVLKKKSDLFAEKENKKKKARPKNVYPPEVLSAMGEFRTYLNKNRLIGIFSKHGEIQGPEQIGKYIKLLLNDAKEDFIKENGNIKITKDMEKIIFSNSGGVIAGMLQEFL